MRILHGAAGVYLALAACAPALACSCGGPVSFCEQLPERADLSVAVFLGKVQSVTETGMERRARLQILEAFTGAGQPVFDLSTHVQASACGVPFVQGQTYLVEAYREGPALGWRTSLCSRTNPLDRAADDLRVLRAWKSGQTLPARISGEVWDIATRRNLPKVPIMLFGGKAMLSTVTDERGQFTFLNLAAGTYQVEAALPSGTRRLTADVTRAWCARVTFTE